MNQLVRTLLTGLVAVSTALTAQATEAKRPGEGVPGGLLYFEPVARLGLDVGGDKNANAAGPARVALSFSTLGRQFDVELEPSQLYAPGAKIVWVDDQGVVEEEPEHIFYRGRLKGDDESWVRMTVRGDAVAGVIHTPDEMYFVEPAERFFADAEPGEAIAYRLSDIDPDWQPGTCAAKDIPGRAGRSNAVAAHEVLGEALGGFAAGGELKRAQVGFVADYEFFQKHGANSAAKIGEVVNGVAGLLGVDDVYRSEVNVAIEILTTVVYTTSSDPFSSTGSPNGLLNEFSDFKDANDNSPGDLLYGADLGHMMTGRNMDGSVIGIAWLSSVCSSHYGSAVSEDYFASLYYEVILVTHEIGHNFSAPHDNQAGSACSYEPGIYIMNPSVGGGGQLQEFSPCSEDHINGHVGGASCLDTVEEGTPTPTQTPTPAPPTATSTPLQPNDAVCISETVPTTMTAGQQYSVTVRFSNTGGNTWTKAAGYRVGSINPYDNSTWGMNRVLMNEGDSVAPGEVLALTWTVTAPSTPGWYNFQWRMLQAGVEWFGSPSTNVVVNVQAAAGGNGAGFNSQVVPTTMTAGQQYSVTVRFSNTGGSTWTKAAGYRIGSINPHDNYTWGMNRVLMNEGDSVAPGQVLALTWTVTAPSTPGSYNFQWRMLQAGVEWFGSPSTNVVVNVQAAAGGNGAGFDSQVVPTTMTAGQQYSVTVRFRNTGGNTWTKAAGYRVGSINPYDNFTWGMNRVLMNEGDSVAPGEVLALTWTVTAPSTPGSYNFQWGMLQAGVEWFGSPSTNVVVNVQAAAGGNGAGFNSQVVPTTMTAGQQYSVTVRFSNTGGSTWTKAAGYRIGSINPYDNYTWGMNRVLMNEGDSVAPGEVLALTWTVTAPSTPGSYNFQWLMLHAGVEWFGSPSTNVVVNVQAP